MDLRKKVARLVMSSISSSGEGDPGDRFRALRSEIVDEGVGGYVIFGGNVDSTAAMIDDLALSSPHPLLVASDLERGLGQQLEGGTTFPSQMAVGAAGQPDLAFTQGYITGLEARAVGINLAFAPVADVNTEAGNPIIGVRSYGGDPQAVGRMVGSFIRGCQLSGVAATAKHFPGHGDTSADSHEELPVVRADRSVINGRELAPFRASLSEGVRAVMTAHVAYPSLGGGMEPATLSPGIVDGVLRSELGFDGLVVSDALLMGGVTRGREPGEAAVVAIEAGVDVLLMPEDVEAAVGGVVAAVDSGRVSEERIDESLARMDSLLSWVGRAGTGDAPSPGVDPDLPSALPLGSPGDERTSDAWQLRHDEAAMGIARRAITLLRDDGLIPLRTAGVGVGGLKFFALVDAERPPNLLWLKSHLNARLPRVDMPIVDDTASESDVDRIVAEASQARVVVVSVFDDVAAWRGRAGPSPSLLRVAHRLLESCPRSALVLFASPQVAAELPEASSVICAYDGSQACQIAAVEAILGEIPIRGRLPVAVPSHFNIGDGLSRG
jgi:beta-N-acetylhexosaminidase